MRKFLLLSLTVVLATLVSGASVNAQNARGKSIDVSREILPIPEEYKKPAKEQGEIVRFDYKVGNGEKYACVYLPYGYDETTRYEIYYVMHGGGDKVDKVLGAPGSSIEFKNALDHLIANGVIKPIIVVAPTFNDSARLRGVQNGMFGDVGAFPQELAQDLMPKLEAKYGTFAETTDEEGLKNSRDHRAFGGFSMGAVTTWNVLCEDLRYFATFMPISGDAWQVKPMGGKDATNETVAALVDAVKKQGYGKDDFIVYAITGDRDIAFPNLDPMMQIMQKSEDGVFGDNVYYRVKKGGFHTIPALQEYLYNAFQDLYRP